jgi:hypothetical protein
VRLPTIVGIASLSFAEQAGKSSWATGMMRILATRGESVYSILFALMTVPQRLRFSRCALRAPRRSAG